jgi:cytochrome c oxidase subunit 3
MGKAEDELSGKELESYKHKRVVRGIAWYMVIASVLLFAGWVSAFIVSKMDKAWVVIDLPKPFYISTLLILSSSITLYLALRFAKQNKQGMLKVFLILTMLLGMSFAYVQYKGWKKLYSQGNVVTGNIFYTYGAYGTDFILLKNEEKIDFDGKDYLINGVVLSESEVKDIREFAYQICGDRRKEKLDDYRVENFSSYSVFRLQQDSLKEGPVEFKEKKAYVNGEVFLASAQKDLFRFAFGVYNQTPLFALKGVYGEDFVIRLNNEILEHENNKLFFPAKDLTKSEVVNINKKVFEGGQEYEIKKGEIYANGEPISQVNFETYVQLNEGIEVHYKDGKWTRLREELNAAQNNELRQAGNTASSYIYVFTGMHVLHVLIALILLSVIIRRSFKGRYSEKNQLGIQATSIIWHFLGALWLSLFLLLQFFH